MSMMKVYQLFATETDEELYLMKGFRKDIIVEINGQVFNLFFIDQLRFSQELENSMEENFFVPDANTIVVKSVQMNNIITQLTQIGEKVISCMMPCAQDGESFFYNLSDAEKDVYNKAGWRISFSMQSLRLLHTVDS